MKTMYNLIYLILELLSFVDNTYLSNFVNTFGVTYVISVSLAWHVWKECWHLA